MELVKIRLKKGTRKTRSDRWSELTEICQPRTYDLIRIGENPVNKVEEEVTVRMSSSPANSCLLFCLQLRLSPTLLSSYDPYVYDPCPGLPPSHHHHNSTPRLPLFPTTLWEVPFVRIAIDHVTWDAYTRHFKARAYVGYGRRWETLDWDCLGSDLERSSKRGNQQSSVH